MSRSIIENNRIERSDRSAFYLHNGSSGNLLTRNEVLSTTTGIQLRESIGNDIVSNSFQSVSKTAVKQVGLGANSIDQNVFVG